MGSIEKIVLAIIGGVVGLLAIIGVAAWFLMFEPMSNVITEEEAKAIAFAHAQVDEVETKLLNIRLGTDDFQRYYDVEFYVGNAEYQYEINAETGRIDDFDVEGLREQTYLQTEAGPAEVQIEDQTGQNKVIVAQANISEDEAAQIVLAKVPGASEANLWIKADLEDGLPVYEGKIIYDGMEYEFELDANDGTMRSWESEWAEADDIPRGSNHAETKQHNSNHDNNNNHNNNNQ